jgi:hypothetical protein
VVIREQLRETKRSLGRKLLEVPGYTFRVFLTNRAEAPEEICANTTSGRASSNASKS